MQPKGLQEHLPMAFAYEYSKTRTDEAKDDDGVMFMASTEDVSVNSGDVFERLSKKYK